MKATVIEVDGTEYELMPGRSEDRLAVYLDVNIHSGGRRVALFKLRCAVYEPEYATIAGTSVEALLEMAMRREDIVDIVRSALQWQSELSKINPEWGVSAICNSWFPKNYEHHV